MDQAYYNGDFYQCLVASGVNENPTDYPAQWERLKIPVYFRRPLTHLTYAHLLELDGQSDKALTVRMQARAEIEDLVRYAANREGWRPRPMVETR